MSFGYILDAVRTPRGRGRAGKGALSGIHPQELFAQALQQLAARNVFDPADVDDVVAGCVSHAGEQGANLARNAVLTAGWPLNVSATTLNRFCGSGAQAVNFAAMGVASGAQQLVVGGGVESMSRVPMGADGGGIDGDNLRLRERIFQVPQGISADLLATLEGFGRAELDAWALRSQQRAALAEAERRFARSLFPVIDPVTGQVALDRDEHARADTTSESLAKLPAAFVAMGAASIGPNGETLDEIALRAYPQAHAIQHLHTAGNSSGIVDGAAAVLVASEAFVRSRGLKPRARIRSLATVGTEPVLMLTAPAPASEKALKLAGMRASDIDLWEINEAFAAVVLQTVRKLGIDPDRVNVNGGAIALGHPLGCTGAKLTTQLIYEMARRKSKYGMVSMCIGGGMGAATIFENLQ